MSIPKSLALWMQPRHLKVIAQTDEGARLLTEVYQRVLDGDVPVALPAYLYSHKILAFSKLSKHQADLEARVDVALAGEEAERDPKLRSIAAGEALLRSAERASARTDRIPKRCCYRRRPFHVGYMRRSDASGQPRKCVLIGRFNQLFWVHVS